MYLNKVFLYGNLGQDPELRALPSGTQVATFSLATTRFYKDKDGNKQEQTDWHNIVLFGRQAEVASQYLKKGRPVFIEGRMQTRSWEDKNDGKKRYRTEVVADRFQFGPGAGSVAGAQEGSSSQENNQSQDSGIEYPEEDIDPDDIPF